MTVVGAHEPTRPSWQCTDCGEAWPCQAGRAQLLAAYAQTPISLCLEMTNLLPAACRELRDVPAGELYDRFVSWSRPPSAKPAAAAPARLPRRQNVVPMARWRGNGEPVRTATAAAPQLGPGQGTWSCMVCGHERPDELIGVAHRPLALERPWPYPNGEPPTVNVRYCTDQAGCAATALGEGAWILGRLGGK